MQTHFWLVLSLIVLLTVQTGYSCICDRRGSVKERIKCSESAFVGRVIRRDTILVQFTEHPQYQAEQISCTFKVSLWLKGFRGQDSCVVASGLGGPDCGADWIPGGEYAVYAWNSSEYLPLDSIAKSLLYSNRCVSPDFYFGEETHDARAEYLEAKIRSAFGRTAAIR